MAKKHRATLNHRSVEALKVTRDTIVWDRRLAGFGVRAYPSGTRVYIAQARGPRGVKRVRLGRHGWLEAREARKAAALAIAKIVAGEEPPGHGMHGRGGPTVAQAAEKYLTEYVAVQCKHATYKRSESVIRLYILPALGRMPMTAVRPADALALHHRLAPTPMQANIVVITLSQVYRKAQLWGLVPPGTNPCSQVKLYRRRRRERFLTGVEIERLGKVLDEEQANGRTSAPAIEAIRLLILTGCRKNEILSLRWGDVNLDARELRLRDTKTGPRFVALSPAAVQRFKGLYGSTGSEWVIPGRKPGTHLKKLGSVWRRLRVRADLADVRLHDLRHSFASTALALGEPLPMIAKLLGHRRIESTARYAHLARGAVREAAERVADNLAKDILPGDGV
ncbi:MAG: tyrosine-type recombinase/integrase [Rhodospirillaceae bacterium]|nr:tyrosine-type recombinase/integrase [Rhodospirillaceae bacterium]MDD9997956.1 tyrosine-type recombinase/integrase [Rhodospirillaceae bacterium]MDE0360700.1 tyrosine-type recombinase/integrase [Rhodospirillaceae bacterium]